MPGKQTALTARLEPSKRQFFQWHKVEQRALSEVKIKMDELTEALTAAGYDYNFVADKESWRSRSRHWNKHAKDPWMVETNQKGRALPIPTKLANTPVWVEWDQDVWDWTNNKWGGKDPSQPLAAHADEHEENYWNTGHCEGQYVTFLMAREPGAFQGSHASLSSQPSTNSPLYPSDLTITMNPGITFHSFNTETVPWPQQVSIPFATIPLPSLPQPGQACNALQNYNCGPNVYDQNYNRATYASDALLPFLSSIHRNEHERVSYMNDIEPSKMPVESWPQQGSESTV